MKNPNGYGCIKLLSGSRRRPYCFVVSQQGKQKVIGYFATKLEAMAYQVDYNQSHGLHRLSDNKITFAELYARWLPKHIEYSSVSDSTIHSYESSYKHCVYLYDVTVAEIKNTVICRPSSMEWVVCHMQARKRSATCYRCYLHTLAKWNTRLMILPGLSESVKTSQSILIKP